jgi:hypothetical protein
MKFSGIEPILAILAAVGWWIVKAIYDRKRDAEMWEEMEETPPARPTPPRVLGIPPPVPQRPQQFPKPPAPPPIVRRSEPIRPVIIHEPEGPARREVPHMKQAQESYSRAAHLQQTVADRLRAIDQQTSTHKASAPPKRNRPTAAPNVAQMFRNPVTVRQAFLAQFVLNPPKALE